MPPRGDSEQRIADALSEVKDDISALTAAVAELAAQLAEALQAESIVRRVAAPGPPATHRAKPRQRRSDTVLRIVRAAAIAVGISVLFLASAVPTRIQQQQWSQCTVKCARPVAHHAPASRPPGR